MIHIIRTPATPSQIEEMLEILGIYIKLAVDVEQGILAGGGEWHADCEDALLEIGCQQTNLWGADWYPRQKKIEYESLINIRPRQNREMEIQSSELRRQIAEIVHTLLGDV
jgi:Protein of unknown function (DUF5674)